MELSAETQGLISKIHSNILNFLTHPDFGNTSLSSEERINKKIKTYQKLIKERLRITLFFVIFANPIIAFILYFIISSQVNNQEQPIEEVAFNSLKAAGVTEVAGWTLYGFSRVLFRCNPNLSIFESERGQRRNISLLKIFLDLEDLKDQAGVSENSVNSLIGKIKEYLRYDPDNILGPEEERDLGIIEEELRNLLARPEFSTKHSSNACCLKLKSFFKGSKKEPKIDLEEPMLKEEKSDQALLKK